MSWEEDVKSILKQQTTINPAMAGMWIDELSLFVRKAQDYTQGGDALGNFTRVSDILALYPYLTGSAGVCVTYLLKQFDCVAHSLSEAAKGKGYPLNEDFSERLRDISVYCKLLTLIINREQHN